MRVFTKGRALLAALGLGLACAGGAQAQSVYDVSAFSGASAAWTITAAIHYPGLTATSNSENAIIGRTVMSGTDQVGDPFQFDTYCIDIFNPLETGRFSESDIASSGFDVSRLTNVETFLDNTNALAVDATTYAAVQIGIWEIMNEDPGTSWNATSGKFYVSGSASAAADALANTWLTALASDAWQPNPSLRLDVLVPQGISQAQVRLDSVAVREPSAVPETASWTMMVAGFGFAGAAMRRRKRTLKMAA